jgi:hypothetical protein
MVRMAGRSHASLRATKVFAILVPIVGLVGWPGRSIASQPRLVQLTAATRIGDTAPEGWTHLVSKSTPHLASGDRDSLPSMAGKTASTFRTAILADVQPLGLEKEFILARVGLAMCVPARDGKDEDIVVSSDRLEALGMRLSTVEEMVLGAAESELAEARIVAFTSTFALLRAPGMLVVGEKHCKVDMYYAFCVEPTTGRLRVGVWAMWPQGKQPPPPSVVLLSPNTVFQCAVDVQARRVLGTVPYSWSFAMQKLPPGKPIPIKGDKPLGDRIVAVTNHPKDVDSGELERMLRKILFAAPVDTAGKTARATTNRRTPGR